MDAIILDDRNGVVICEKVTAYLLACLKEATKSPGERPRIYAVMAKALGVDPDRMTAAVVRYADKMRHLPKPECPPPSIEELRRAQAPLCRKLGHRDVPIRLSQVRVFHECLRCGRRKRAG